MSKSELLKTQAILKAKLFKVVCFYLVSASLHTHSFKFCRLNFLIKQPYLLTLTHSNAQNHIIPRKYAKVVSMREQAIQIIIWCMADPHVHTYVLLPSLYAFSQERRKFHFFPSSCENTLFSSLSHACNVFYHGLASLRKLTISQQWSLGTGLQ